MFADALSVSSTKSYSVPREMQQKGNLLQQRHLHPGGHAGCKCEQKPSHELALKPQTAMQNSNLRWNKPWCPRALVNGKTMTKLEIIIITYFSFPHKWYLDIKIDLVVLDHVWGHQVFLRSISTVESSSNEHCSRQALSIIQNNGGTYSERDVPVCKFLKCHSSETQTFKCIQYYTGRNLRCRYLKTWTN